MITIQPNPTNGVLCALAPVIYEVTATSISANPPLIKGQLFINGAAYTVPNTQQHYKVIAGVYTFRFDFAQALQQYLSNTDTFLQGANTNTAPSAGAANVGFAKKCEFYVVFTVWQSQPPFGVYAASATTHTSSTLFALNIAANQFLLESQIERYTGTQPLLFLTNAPSIRPIPLNEAAYLSFWDDGGSRRGLRVRRYDENGVLLATDYIDIGQTPNALKRVRRLSVGTAHLPYSFTGVRSYDVCVVLDYTIPVPLPLTEVRTFVINNAPCKRYIVRWLNVFGADDYDIFEEYELRTQTQQEGYLANVSAYPARSLRGRTTLNSRGDVGITLSKAGVPQAQGFWYYELRNSPVVFLHEVGDYANPTAVVIDGETEAVIAGTGRGGALRVEVPLLYANTEYSQSN